MVLVALFFLQTVFAISNLEDLENPRKAVHSFVYWQVQDQSQPDRATQIMAADTSLSQEERRYRARQLLSLLDAKGLYVDLSKIPGDPQYRDSLSGRQVFVLFPQLPEIFLEKLGDVWLLAPSSVAAIPVLYRRTFSLMVELVLDQLPHWMHLKLLNFELWQLAGVIIWLLIGIFAALLVRIVIKRYLKNWASASDARWDDTLIFETAKPVLLLALIGFYYITYSNLRFPVGVNAGIVWTLRLGLTVGIIWLFYGLSNVLSNYIHEILGVAGGLNEQMAPLVRKLLKTVVILLGTLLVLQNLGIDVGSVLAGLGLGGLAFALAARETLANLFGSLMIFLDKPFKIGERIQIDTLDGVVEEVGFRSTRFRLLDDVLVSMPNAKLADVAIRNFSARTKRRLSQKLSIAYTTPPEKIEAFIEGVRAIILANPNTDKENYNVDLWEFAPSSLDILMVAFVVTDSWDVEAESRHAIQMQILRLGADLGISFAFPTQSVHIESWRRESAVTETPKENLAKVVSAYAPDGEKNNLSDVELRDASGAFIDLRARKV